MPRRKVIFNTSRIELKKSNLKNNIQFLNTTIGQNRKLSIVVKGNAYGHGYDNYIPMLKNQGVDHFSVFSAQEAFEVKKYIEKSDALMIMGDTPAEALDWIVENEVEIFVFNLERLKFLLTVAKRLKKKARIHLEFETGMKRTGIEEKKIEEVFRIVKKNIDLLDVRGVCTHLAGAESISNYIRIQEQIKNFKRIKKQFRDSGIKVRYFHCACSAAAIRYPETCMDLIRVGILSYGFWPSQETLIEYLNRSRTYQNPLRRVIEWKTSIMALKTVARGDFVGYGSSFQATREMKLAVLPVGYETGFSRGLSNKGSVLIDGQYAYIVGTVNMNAITVNVTHIPDVKIGDEAVIIGKQGKNEISVAAFSDLGEQLNYELLTRLPLNIPRKVVS